GRARRVLRTVWHQARVAPARARCSVPPGDREGAEGIERRRGWKASSSGPSARGAARNCSTTAWAIQAGEPVPEVGGALRKPFARAPGLGRAYGSTGSTDPG